MQNDVKLVKTTIIAQVTSIIIGAVVWLVSAMVSNHFINSNLVERVSTLEENKLDIKVYLTDSEPVKQDVKEIKQDVKTLLSRKQVFIETATIEE